MTDHETLIAELQSLAAQWRTKAERHKEHGDAYRVGEGWGLVECADELEALLTLVREDGPRAQHERQLQGFRCPRCDRAFFVEGVEEAYACPICRAEPIWAMVGPFRLLEGRQSDGPHHEQDRPEKGSNIFDSHADLRQNESPWQGRSTDPAADHSRLTLLGEK
jgi:predicted Zn-ribbon and HTH transcriptional regulator